MNTMHTTRSTRKEINSSNENRGDGDGKLQAHVTTRFEISNARNRAYLKDSLQPRIPTIGINCMLHNRQRAVSSCRNNRPLTQSAIGATTNSTSCNVVMDTRKVRRSQQREKHSHFDPSFNCVVESVDSINNSCNHDGRRGRRYNSCTSTRSACRPIRRSEQEQARLRLEEKVILATETEYDLATWRMYSRIMKYREKHPLPDTYYDEINSQTSNGTTTATDSDQYDSATDNTDNTVIPPSDDVTAITNSSSSSLSPSFHYYNTNNQNDHSPNFVSLQHSSSRRFMLPTNVYNDHHHHQDDSYNFGLPQMVLSNYSNYYDSINMIQNDDSSDESANTDEYTDMMMFDLELE